MAEQLANNAAGTLASTIAFDATSLSLGAGEGAAFPASGDFRIVVDDEIILVGARTGDTLSSLTRGAEGTTAATHFAGADVAQVLTKGGLSQYVTDAVDAAIAALPPSGPTITSSAFSSGPPASPSDGDIWIATDVDANGTAWQFRYNAGSASTYKWEFIGGSAVQVADTATRTVNTMTNLASSGWYGDANARYTIVRAGDYEYEIVANPKPSGSASVDMGGAKLSGGVLTAPVGGGRGNADVGSSVQVNLKAQGQGTFAAGDVLYHASSGTSAALTGTTVNRTLSVIPKRIA